jgi:hypothetical protein
MSMSFNITVARHVADLVRYQGRVQVWMTELPSDISFQLHLYEPKTGMYAQVRPRGQDTVNPRGLFNNLQSALRYMEAANGGWDWKPSTETRS